MAHDERQVSVNEAERLAGRRLDRRRSYAVIDGIVCELASWTDSCSGCFEGGEYMGLAYNYLYDHKAGCHIGSGCSECGYTGKRRREWWLPIDGYGGTDGKIENTEQG